MNAGPYIFDYVENTTPTVMLEVPFTVRPTTTSLEDFADIAARDFAIISSFVRRKAARQNIDPGAVDIVLSQASTTVCSSAAWLRCFMVLSKKATLIDLCGMLYTECLANLPAKFCRGGLKLAPKLAEETKPAPRKWAPVKFQDMKSPKVDPAVEELVPNP